MDYKKFISEILIDVCADERVHNGTVDIESPYHIQIIKEYVSNRVGSDFAEEFISTIKNKNLEEGNYPERQAYNENGVLVTFPDTESKKAAIKRGTHFENPPGGSSPNENSEDEDEDEQSDMFSNLETPEKQKARKDIDDKLKVSGTNIDVDNIKLSDDDEGEVHHLYDILKNIKTSKDDVDDETGVGLSDAVNLDRLHPSVLFALHEKWVFDKSGDWYDEFGKFRGDTDSRGQVNPYRSIDKDKMEEWIEDYKKRKSGIDVDDSLENEED